VFRCGAEGVWVRVSKDDTICGLAAPTARQLMRAYFGDRPVEVACDILGVSQDDARDQMHALEAAGYVECGGLAHAAGNDWWATTVKGNALANASFGKPISRATATRLLGQVIERARAYNADPARLLTVTEIVVFGSYLDPAAGQLAIWTWLCLRCAGIRTDSGTRTRSWSTPEPAGAASARSTTGCSGPPASCG